MSVVSVRKDCALVEVIVNQTRATTIYPYNGVTGLQILLVSRGSVGIARRNKPRRTVKRLKSSLYKNNTLASQS